jgi:hypothetical protein
MDEVLAQILVGVEKCVPGVLEGSGEMRGEGYRAEDYGVRTGGMKMMLVCVFLVGFERDNVVGIASQLAVRSRGGKRTEGLTQGSDGTST